MGEVIPFNRLTGDFSVRKEIDDRAITIHANESKRNTTWGQSQMSLWSLVPPATPELHFPFAHWVYRWRPARRPATRGVRP